MYPPPKTGPKYPPARIELFQQYCQIPPVIPYCDRAAGILWDREEEEKKDRESGAYDRMMKKMEKRRLEPCIVCGRRHITSQDCPIPDTTSYERDILPLDERTCFHGKMKEAEEMRCMDD